MKTMINLFIVMLLSFFIVSNAQAQNPEGLPEMQCPTIADLQSMVEEKEADLLQKEMERCLKREGSFLEAALGNAYAYKLLVEIAIAYSTKETVKYILDHPKKPKMKPNTIKLLKLYKQLMKSDEEFFVLKNIMRCLLTNKGLPELCIKENCHLVQGPHAKIYYSLFGGKKLCQP